MSDKLYAGRKGNKNLSTAHKRSNIKNRRPPNRHSVEADSEFVSTSAKKLKVDDKYDRDVDDLFGYRFVNFLPVFTAISQVVVCKECKGDVSFSEGSRRGLGSKIILTCKNCGDHSISTCPLINNRGYEINTRIVFAMRLLGIGINGIKKFCSFMCLPKPVFQVTYDKIVANIAIATESVRTLCLKEAAEKEKLISINQGENDGLTVSGDGSWRRRGFSSLFGVTTLIGWHTGKVLDVCVKSKYCKICEYWARKVGTAEYEEEYAKHESQCEANHTGSAGKMEVDSVVEMFQRSETLHNVKYLNYIGDGDSKTYKGIVDAKPYENCSVFKKECVGHVEKRMGTRLRNLKKTTKGLGGRGKLTGKLIDELTIFYGLAIRRNTGSVEKMRNDIWATLYHKISSDEKPQHDKCPSGVDSWCSWQRAKALGSLTSYTHKPPMPEVVFKTIKPIYKDLSSDDLLSRCLGGYTQNANESFNSVVWSIAPKAVSSGKKVVDIATDIAVLNFNDGLSSLFPVYDTLGLSVGRNLYDFCLESDENRIKAAEHSLSDAAKNARRSITSMRKELEETNTTTEGQLYGAGIAE